MSQLNLTKIFLNGMITYGPIVLGLTLLIGAASIPVPGALLILGDGAFAQQGIVDLPSIGRDPNLYRYVLEDSVNFVEPSSLLYKGLFPGRGPDWHHNRNKHQTCPSKEPVLNSYEVGGGGWDYEGKSLTHGGWKRYRGTGAYKGYQCVYNDTGILVTDKDFEGTYDYVSPYYDGGWLSNPVSGTLRFIGHLSVDVLPWLIFGN